MHCAERETRYWGETEVSQTPPCPVSRAQSLGFRTHCQLFSSYLNPLQCSGVIGDKVRFLYLILLNLFNNNMKPLALSHFIDEEIEVQGGEGALQKPSASPRQTQGSFPFP